MAIASDLFRNLAKLKGAAGKAPYDDALAAAKRAAARPVSKGGLGLRPDNTAMERAAAMGYAPGYYSGSGNMHGIESLLPQSPTAKGEAGRVWLTDNPNDASQFAQVYGGGGKEAPGVFPLMYRGSPNTADASGELYDPEMMREILRGNVGKDVEIQRIQNFEGSKPTTTTAIINPADIRSRFAAFNPDRGDEPDLLASMAPYAVPTAAVGLAGLGVLAAPGEAQASPYSALAGLYKSVGKKLPWTEQDLIAGLPKGRTIAPQDLALEAARREAEAMGLPASNTAAERAAAMEYLKAGDLNDAPGVSEYWLHGTPEGDISKFLENPPVRNRAGNNSVGPVWTTNSPSEANFYAKGGHSIGGTYKDAIERGLSPTVYPLMIRGNYKHNPSDAKHVGAPNTANFTSRGSDQEWAVAGSPELVRSRFSAMNPALKDSSNLLAGLGGAAVGAGALMAPGDSEAGIAAQSGASLYADMQALKRVTNARARTHAGPPTMTPGAQTARTLAIEAMNPASWPLFWGSRELGDPQALGYADPYYSYSGATRR